MLQVIIRELFCIMYSYRVTVIAHSSLTALCCWLLMALVSAV